MNIPLGMKQARPVSQKKLIKKQKQQKKRTRKITNVSPSALRQTENFYMSPCAKKYLKALCDPFQPITGVCIPDNQDAPSLKFFSRVRGGMNVGTGQVGFVIASAQNQTNDSFAVCSTIATFVTINVPQAGVTVGTLSVPNAQFPYTTAQLNAFGYVARVVAAGIRIRYTGTELNRSGRVFCVRVPSDQTLVAATVPGILSRSNVKTKIVDRSWHGLSYIPTLSSDFDYKSTDQVLGAANVDLVIGVEGAVAGNGFEYEAVWMHEICNGAAALGVNPLTTSHSDTVGLSASRSFFEQTEINDAGPGVYDQAINFMKQFSLADVSRFISGGVQVYNSL